MATFAIIALIILLAAALTGWFMCYMNLRDLEEYYEEYIDTISGGCGAISE
jgi:hypothetical protein